MLAEFKVRTSHGVIQGQHNIYGPKRDTSESKWGTKTNKWSWSQTGTDWPAAGKRRRIVTPAKGTTDFVSGVW